MRYLFGFFIFLLIIAGATGLGGYFLVDEQRIIGAIEGRIQEETGCRLTIGTINVSLFPTPNLDLTHLKLSNGRDYGQRSEIASISRLTMDMGWAELLSGHLDIDKSITVYQPVLHQRFVEGCSQEGHLFGPPAPVSQDEQAGFSFDIKESELTFEVIEGSIPWDIPGARKTVDLTEISGLIRLDTARNILKLRLQSDVLGHRFEITGRNSFARDEQILALNIGHKDFGALALTAKRPARSGDGTWTGQVAADDLGALFEIWLGEKSLEKIGFEANFQSHETGLSFTDMNLRIPGAKFGGIIEYLSDGSGRINVALLAAQINLDELSQGAPSALSKDKNAQLEHSGSSATSQAFIEANGFASINHWHQVLNQTEFAVSLDIEADQIIWHGRLFQNLSMSLSKPSGPSALTVIEDVRVKLPGNGRFQGRFSAGYESDGRSKIEGNVSINGSDIRPILEIAGLGVHPDDEGLLRQYEFQSDLQWKKDKIDLRNMMGRIDQTNFRGGIAYLSDKRHAMGIGLYLDRFNPSLYISEDFETRDLFVGETGSTGSIPSRLRNVPVIKEWLSGLSINSRFEFSQLQLDNIMASDVGLEARWLDKKLGVRTLKIDDINGMKVQLDGQIDFADDVPKMDLKGQARITNSRSTFKSSVSSLKRREMFRNLENEDVTFTLKNGGDSAEFQASHAKSNSVLRLLVSDIEWGEVKNAQAEFQWITGSDVSMEMTSDLNWHGDNVSFENGRGLYRGDNEQRLSMDWIGQFDYGAHYKLDLEGEGEGLNPFVTSLDALGVTISGRDVLDIKVNLDVNAIDLASMIERAQLSGQATLETNWDVNTDQPVFKTKNLDQAQQWLLKNIDGQRDFDTYFLWSHEGVEVHAAGSEADEAVIRWDMKQGRGEDRVSHIEFSKSKLPEYILVDLVRNNGDETLKIGGAWLRGIHE